MSSKTILRKAVVEEAPLIIDNAYAVPYSPDEMEVPDDLVEALQHENPDAAPDEIEDAIHEVMDQLREQSPDAGLPGLEPSDFEIDPAMLGVEEEEDGPDFLNVSSEVSVPDLGLAPEGVLGEARPAAADVLENARREAQQVLAEADERAAEIERAAYEKGYEEGVEAGKAGGEEQAREIVKQVVAIVDRATELHDAMLADAEAEVVALALEIARKIIQSELRTNPDVVKSVLSAAVKKINGSPRVTVKVNPGQLEAVRAHWDAAFGPNYREKEWVIEGDPNVTAGGCVLDTKYGSIDARIGTQFAEIQKTFSLLLGTSS